jgi:hypothetical protein
MNRIVLFLAILLSALGQSAVAANLVHELKVESYSCSSASADLTPDEINSIQSEWLSPTELKVSFWGMETPSYVIRRSGSTAALEAGQVDLSIAIDKVAHDPNQPIAMCAWPAHIIFTIHGLPRHAYEIKIHHGTYLRTAKVEG